MGHNMKIINVQFVVQGSEDPEQHGVYVWRHFVQKSKAKHIAIVGHSYGGVVTAAMVSLCTVDH